MCVRFTLNFWRVRCRTEQLSSCFASLQRKKVTRIVFNTSHGLPRMNYTDLFLIFVHTFQHPDVDACFFGVMQHGLGCWLGQVETFEHGRAEVG